MQGSTASAARNKRGMGWQTRPLLQVRSARVNKGGWCWGESLSRWFLLQTTTSRPTPGHAQLAAVDGQLTAVPCIRLQLADRRCVFAGGGAHSAGGSVAGALG